MIHKVLIIIAVFILFLVVTLNRREKKFVKKSFDEVFDNVIKQNKFFNQLRQYKFFDKKILIGLGIGILVSSISTIIFYKGDMSDAEIEKRAMELGMKYPTEMKVIE